MGKYVVIKSINSATLVGMLCAPRGLILVSGGYHSPSAYEHLDGWHITGQCLLRYLIVPLTVHNQTETPHW